MEVVVEDLGQQYEELRKDVNKLKEQMGQILEMLKSMQNPKGDAPEQPRVTPNHPLGPLPYIPPMTLHTTNSSIQHQSLSYNPTNMRIRIPLKGYNSSKKD
ncbi:hypothetical protein CR513_39023, partial [Mucuna pruriens]